MPVLTTFLQQEFYRHCPKGWHCTHEQPVLSGEWEQLLGYAPRVDVLLERDDGTKRLWVEFEISRADPVANHAKFATAHLFQPQSKTDTFLSMVSAHVTHGRQNLAANTIHLMRAVGMRAFQTPLFPTVTGKQIKYFNHLHLSDLVDAPLDIQAELARAFAVVKPVFVADDRDIHYASNGTDILLNIFRWNQDIATPVGRTAWGKRVVTYFVCDPRCEQFAPSKFCAYIPIPSSRYQITSDSYCSMTIPFYVTIDGSHPKFDGNLAWNHLVNNLAMQLVLPDEKPLLQQQFMKWLGTHNETISVHPSGPRFLLPPPSF